MYSVGSIDCTPKYLERGNLVFGTNIVDDSQVLNRDPGPISRVVAYAKKFVWGFHIFYADGSTTGLHNGFMEPEVIPEYKELILDPEEFIVQLSGYISEFVGAIHIKTNFGKTLDIGSTPLGELFTLQVQGHIIQKLIFGYKEYLSYIGVFACPSPMGLTPPTAMSDFDYTMSRFTYPGTIGTTVGIVSPSFNQLSACASINCSTTVPVQSYQIELLAGMGSPYSSIGIIPVVEFTAMFGKETPTAKKFNDYEDVVLPALKAGFKVKISRIKIYKKNNILLGIKPVYEITCKSGKMKKEERPHYSSEVGFFTSRDAMNFKGKDYLSHIAGRANDCIRKIKIVSSNGQIIEFGPNEGSEFLMVPKSKTGILAFSGSVDASLCTLRAYFLR